MTGFIIVFLDIKLDLEVWKTLATFRTQYDKNGAAVP
jgi:hypothetical protein